MKLATFVVVAALAALAPFESGRAASAVAWSSNFTYAYCAGEQTEQAAIDCALKRCAARTERTCKVGVSCPQTGHGAVVLRIYPVGEVEAIGAACGAASAAAAAQKATDICNRSSRPGRCEPPTDRWQD